jgi:hypothetical protein
MRILMKAFSTPNSRAYPSPVGTFVPTRPKRRMYPLHFLRKPGKKEPKLEKHLASLL